MHIKLRHSASSEAYDTLTAFLTEMDALDRMETTSCRSSDASSQQTSSPTPSSAASPLPANATTARTTTHAAPGKKRIRAKQEIDMLRNDVEALQQQLASLQATETQAQSAGDVPQEQRTRPAAAKKPRLRRVSCPVLAENEHLRKLIGVQQKLSKQIANVLSKMRQTKLRSVLLADTSVPHGPLSRADLVVYYDALTGKLDALYAQLDEVFADVNLQTLEQQFADAKVVMDGDTFTVLQMRDVKVLPFDFDIVKDTAWQYLKAESVQSGESTGEFFVPNSNDDVVLLRRELTVQLDGSANELEIPMRAVAKRFVTKDRMVFCWDGSADWPHALAPADSSRSVPVREKGWAMIKAVPGTAYSTVQVCILMSPGLSDERVLELASREEMDHGLHNVVIPTYQQVIGMRHQLLENLLIDEQLLARQQRSARQPASSAPAH